ncbi:hypothetical protein [Limibacterium fermenti]|uniref:hypothetical protein n=1 Tax=Limibacterium fermenti TaxID=3229863 RepID=UPI000E89C325|nr:hypothetical protein [Porphyromonadaceae bacterium]
MKRIKWFFTIIIISILSFSAHAQEASFEGIITSRIVFGEVDLSPLAEKIDYHKGNVQEQIGSFFRTLPTAQSDKLQAMIERNPMMTIALLMIPPQTTLYIKGGTILAKMKGLGYEMEHYHNLSADEAFIYTASLIDPQNAATSTYKPSEGYKELFAGNKLITPDKYTFSKLPQTATVAGYVCNVSSYVPKSAPGNATGANGLPAVDVRKLIVYTNSEISKTINFSHPYYIPEADGILRIDIFLEDSDQPTMVYEMIKVDKTTVNDSQLQIKKSQPLYQLTDMEYGMKLLGITMEGISSLGDE